MRRKNIAKAPLAQAKTDPLRWPEERIEAAREVAAWILDSIAVEHQHEGMSILCLIARDFPGIRLDVALCAYVFRNLLEKPRVVLQ